MATFAVDSSRASFGAGEHFRLTRSAHALRVVWLRGLALALCCGGSAHALAQALPQMQTQAQALPQASPLPLAALPDAGTLLNQQPKPEPSAPAPGDEGALPKAPAPTATPGEPGAPNAPAAPCAPCSADHGASGVTSASGAAEGTSFVLKSVRFEGNDSIDGSVLNALMQRAIGQSVTLEDLNALAASVVQLYRQRGHALAQVVIPPQDVTNGDVKMIVLEGRLGRVNVVVGAGARISEKAVRARLAALQPGTPLRQHDLERAMLLLSDLPGVRVTSAIEAGSEPGTEDLTVTVEPTRPWQFSASVDNEGTGPAGRWRLGLVGRANSPFGIGDSLDFNVHVAERWDTVYGRIGYEAPVNAQGTRVGLAYSHLYYALGQNFAPLGAYGDADVVTLSVSHPLIRSRSENLLLHGALEYRHLIDKIGSESLDSRQHLMVASAGLSYESRDSFLGGGFNSAALTLSVANLTIESDAQRMFDQSAFGRHTEGTSVRATMFANRLNAITSNFSLFVGVTGQWANQNLDSSSQITLGGPQAVRAYSPSEAVVDEGVVGTAELRYAVRPNLTISTFFDIGWGRFVHPLPGQHSINRSGAGVGVFWAGPAGIAVSATVAWRTTGPDTTGDDKLPRVYVQLSKSF
jgi:hemolysin activation/secretion protein